MSTASVLTTPRPGRAASSPLARVKPPPRPPAARVPKQPRVQIPSESVELLQDLHLEPNSVARNAVPLAQCTRTLGSIDVASGKVALEQMDFALGSIAPLRFDRVWLSCSTYRGPLGHGWHHAYDVALARGSETFALRTADGRAVWLAGPAANGASYNADERLALTRDKYGYAVRDAAGTEQRFVPHRAQAAFVLGSRRTADGQELRFGYDHRARLVRITDRRGVDLELDYDANDRIVEVRAADPLRAGKRIVVVQFAYDPRDNLRKATDALGQARRYGYERTLLAKYVDRNGCSTQFEWDGVEGRERCVHGWVDADVRVRKLEYHEGRTRVVDSLGQATSYAHDGGLVHRIVDPLGNVRELARGPSHRIEREVDELGHERRRVYDARGNLLELRAADGGSCSFEYDARDRLRRALDAVGGAWEVVYDDRGRLSRLLDPLGQVTRFHHRGRWLSGVTEPNQRHTAFAYDDAGRLAACTSADGSATRYQYDAWGQLTGVTDPNGNFEQRDYDLLGRLVRVQQPNGSRLELTYDAEGNLVQRKDALHDVRFTYQGTGRLSSRSECGYTVCFEYDSEEQLVGVVNEGGKLFRLRRDASGRVVETVGFDGCVRTYARDAAGRVVRVGRGESFSEYERDALGRVIEVQHSDGAFEGYRYRPDGALVSAWNQLGTISFERDVLGRVVREFQGDHCLEFGYDAVGQLLELRSSLGTRQIAERDRAGRVRRIQEQRAQLESKVVRDALGLEIERTLLGGGRSAWQRDTYGRPSAFRLENAAGELMHKLVYEWDQAGQLRRCTDGRRGTTEYHYDVLGNLAWLQTATGSYQLRMPDAVGNVFARDDRRDREYGPAGQLLVRSTRQGEVHCTHDAAGNLVERREPGSRCWRYAWSASGLLQRLTAPDGSDITFGYDVFGRRVWKKAHGQTTRFVWAGPALLHEWVESANAAAPVAIPADEEAPTIVLAQASDGRGTRAAPVTWVHDFDSGWPLARLGPAGNHAVVTDHEGTPRALLDERGHQVWAAERSVTGEARVLEGDRAACLLRGHGLYEDLETGLYCGGLPARHYDAGAGVAVDQGAIAARPALRAYALAHEPPPRPCEPVPPHAWFARVAAPSVAGELPWLGRAQGAAALNLALSPLMAAGPVELTERMLECALEEPREP